MSRNGRKRCEASARERKGDSQLITALAAGASINDAAQMAQVSQRTVYRRLKDATFRRCVADARGQFIAAAMGRLAKASTRAVETLLELLTADADSVKLGAARSILEFSSRLRETVELAERVNELETRFAANGEPSRTWD